MPLVTFVPLQGKGSDVGKCAGFLSWWFSYGQKDVVLGPGPIIFSEAELWGR